MEKVIELLINANLLTSRSNFIYLVVGFIIVAFLIIGFAKKMISIIITSVLCLCIFGSLYMVKVSVVDNNGLQFESTGIATSTGDFLRYDEIKSVDVRNSNTKLVLVGKDGEEVSLKIDASKAKALKGAIDAVIEKKSED
jgi:hypothetical protein